MTTNVPSIQFTPTGIVIPSESDILTGVQEDMNAAFGGGLNPALETPQGQQASSTSAIIGDKNSQVAYIVNQVDPQYSAGRFQDAIGRIYFLTRHPATSTLVACTVTGVLGTVLPQGTLAADTSGNYYASTAPATIPGSGTIAVNFSNVKTGPIPCSASTLVTVYQSIPGWDAITNAADGILGTNVESQQEFEFRRKNSVALNSHGTPDAIFANVFNILDVTDCYVQDNPKGNCAFTGSISATALSVSAIASGYLAVGDIVTGVGVTSGTRITAIVTPGTAYTVTPSQSASSTAMLAVGVAYGITNYVIPNHSVYVGVVGGTSSEIGKAIWDKKDVGCDTIGNTPVTVTDTIGYNYPYPTYTINYNVPTSLPIHFNVNIVNTPSVPSNINALVTAAIIAQFNGQTGVAPERIGGTIFASRYYSTVASVSPGINVTTILVGTSTATLNDVPVGIDQNPTITAANIAVNLV